MKKLILTIILQVFTISGIYGNSYGEINLDHTGDTYLRYCKNAIAIGENDGQRLNDQQISEGGNCITYVSAFIDSHLLESYFGNSKSYCYPDGVTIAQFIRSFVKFLEDHPEKLHQDRAKLLYDSLIQAFPCPNQKK